MVISEAFSVDQGSPEGFQERFEALGGSYSTDGCEALASQVFEIPPFPGEDVFKALRSVRTLDHFGSWVVA